MPEGYHARHGDRAERYARASDDPPAEQRHPAHDKGSEPFVGSRRNDVGEMVLSLLRFSMIPFAQARVFGMKTGNPYTSRWESGSDLRQAQGDDPLYNGCD